MKIVLGSENPSKKRSVEQALEELNIKEYEVVCLKANSKVDSKPIGYEIIRGAENRNLDIKNKCIEKNIDYDYLCSIEGGFSLDENGLPFVVTYAIVESKNGKKSTGKSLCIRLSKDMFNYVKSWNSLNKAIENILLNENNKQNMGITGYLTNGMYSRDIVDKQAVISALISFIFSEQRQKLEIEIKKN